MRTRGGHMNCTEETYLRIMAHPCRWCRKSPTIYSSVSTDDPTGKCRAIIACRAHCSMVASGTPNGVLRRWNAMNPRRAKVSR